MKARVINLIKTYFLFVCIFLLQKPLFMLFYCKLYAETNPADWFSVMYHGLPLDFSLAGYLTALPGLLLVISAWTTASWLRQVRKGYFLLMAVLLSVIFVVDIGLYDYWGFRLDATPLFYFFSSPKDALASVSIWMVLLGLLAMLFYALLLYILFAVVLLRGYRKLKVPYARVTVSSVLLLLTGLLFIPIRGGFSEATMNTGRVYYSSNLRLNHAATNPAFNLMESALKQKDFANQYRFLEAAEADSLFSTLIDPAVAGAAVKDTLSLPVDTLLTTNRPNVLFVILESFSSHLMGELGGLSNVAVNLDTLSWEGVLFTHLHANSFRTDRGLVSVLSGYPAQPTNSIMKYPRKSQTLPSIAGKLKEVGYQTKYYYGGDANFTNMRSYLRSSGFDEIVSEDDFPLAERESKWGVYDHRLFQYLLDDLKQEAEIYSPKDAPTYRVLQTSSSHEPFEVPYRRLKNDRLNAFSYTDNCLGDFIRAFKKLPQWDNTLIVLVPDHLGAYPEQVENLTVERYQIPMLFIGGAVKQPRRIPTYGSQHDLAATLLAQLGIPHGEFTFSKDLLNPSAPHFAFFTVPDAFGLVTPDNALIYDCKAGRIALDEGVSPGRNLPLGQSYLQKLYDDLAGR
ncbi:MAG: sulfatase-like hydrolase/transferase [Bacteroides sp.]|nr:sulfatase-like hydrolase/transferase [Bacteroides sp.]